MAKIERDQITQIKQSVNIVDIISQYVALSKTGKNYLGLCPFHGEKTPSFNVNEDKQFYHCFGCGKSGDVIKFIEDYKQVSFMDSIKEVADYAGITLDISKEYNQDNPNQPLYEIHTQASRFYHMLLTSTELGEKAREYLYDRGIDDNLIEQFNIGLAPNQPDLLYKSLSSKFDEKILSESGLFTFTEKSIYDSFRDRIMFPLTNEFSQTIGFSGRIWQENQTEINHKEAKYKNTTTTPIFNKSYELYNLDKARDSIGKNHEVYLMEGFMDVIAAYKSGVTNVVATMGTALTENHIKKLQKKTQKFVLVYDGDKAGQAATYKSLKLLDDFKKQIVRIPENLDPDEYSKKYPNQLKNLMVENRISDLEFLIDYLKPENLYSVDAESDFVDRLAPLIADEESLTKQNFYIKKLADLLPDFSYEELERVINNQRENVQKNFDREELHLPPMYEEDKFVESTKIHPLDKIERHLLFKIMRYPYLLKEFMEDETFSFTYAKNQDLFNKVLLMYLAIEDIDESYLIYNLSDDLVTLWYEIQALDLPEGDVEREIKDLRQAHKKQKILLELNTLENQINQVKKNGNKDEELILTLEYFEKRKELQ